MNTEELCNAIEGCDSKDPRYEELVSSAMHALRILELEKLLLMSEKKNDSLLASEAIYGFMSWLAAQKFAITFGGKNNAGIGSVMIEEFIIKNELQEPRIGWKKALRLPL